MLFNFLTICKFSMYCDTFRQSCFSSIVNSFGINFTYTILKPNACSKWIQVHMSIPMFSSQTDSCSTKVHTWSIISLFQFVEDLQHKAIFETVLPLFNLNDAHFWMPAEWFLFVYFQAYILLSLQAYLHNTMTTIRCLLFQCKDHQTWCNCSIIMQMKIWQTLSTLPYSQTNVFCGWGKIHSSHKGTPTFSHQVTFPPFVSITKNHFGYFSNKPHIIGTR